MKAHLLSVFSGHSDAIYDLCHGLEDSHFYSASADHFIGCWNREMGTFEKPLAKAVSPIYCMELIREKGWMLIGTRSGIIHVIDIKERQPLHSLQLHTKSVFDIQYLPDNDTFLAAGEDGILSVWNATDAALIHSYQLSMASLRSIALSPDKRSLAVGGSDHSIRIFALPDLGQSTILEGHGNSVFTCLFIDDDTLISGSRDAHILQWKKDGENWNIQEKIPAHNFTINHIALSPNKKYIASASRDKSVKIWDSKSLSLLKVLDRNKFDTAHSHSVNRVLWLDDNNILSAGDDRRIIAWHIEG